MAVFRIFRRMFCGALFALGVMFATTNVGFSDGNDTLHDGNQSHAGQGIDNMIACQDSNSWSYTPCQTFYDNDQAFGGDGGGGGGTSSLCKENASLNHCGDCTCNADATGIETCSYVLETYNSTSKTCLFDVTYEVGYYGPAQQTGTKGFSPTATACTNAPSNSHYTSAGTNNQNNCTWQSNNATYTISYIMNGGTYGDYHPSSAVVNEVFQVSKPTHPNGWDFNGWVITNLYPGGSQHLYGTTSSVTSSTYSTSVTVAANVKYFKNLIYASGSSSYSAVLFTAQWKKTCNAGKYFSVDSDGKVSCKMCELGAYCPGVTVNYSASPTNNQGIYSCNTETNGNYPYALREARSKNYCYKTSTKTCAEINPISSSSVDVTYPSVSVAAKQNYGSSVWFAANYSTCEASFSCKTGYNNLIQNASSVESWFEMFTPTDSTNYVHYGPDSYGTNPPLVADSQFMVEDDYPYYIFGEARCSTTQAAPYDTGTPDSTFGDYCWCRMTSMADSPGTLGSRALSSWMFLAKNPFDGCINNNTSACSQACAYAIVGMDYSSSATLNRLFTSAKGVPSCTANTYNVVFKTGDTQLGTQSFTYGTAQNLNTIASMNTNVPSLLKSNGWTFAGWATSPNTTTVTYTNGQSVNNLTTTNGGTVTLYGVWYRIIVLTMKNDTGPSYSETNTTKIQYYRNTSTTAADGTAVTDMPIPDTSTYGWDIVGYLISSAPANVSTYQNGVSSTYTPQTNSVNSYNAVYKRTPTITYSANGGTGTTTSTSCGTQTYNAGQNSALDTVSCTLANSGFTRTGYTFSGWSDGNATNAAGAAYTFTDTSWNSSDTKNMTAQWTPNCNAITLNPGNGGTSGSISTLYKKTGSSQLYKDSNCTTQYTSSDYNSVIPSRSGYSFVGFFGGSTKTISVDYNSGTLHINKNGAGTSTTVSAATTIYAWWAKNCTYPVDNGSCSLSINTNGAVDYTTSCESDYVIFNDNTADPVCEMDFSNVVRCEEGEIVETPGEPCVQLRDISFNDQVQLDAGLFNFLYRYPEVGDIFYGDISERVGQYIKFYGLKDIDEIKQHLYSTVHYVLPDNTCSGGSCDSDLEEATYGEKKETSTNFGTSYWYLNSSPINSKNYIIYMDGTIIGVNQDNGQTWQYNYATDGSFTGITYPNFAVTSAVDTHNIESVNNVRGLAYCPIGQRIENGQDQTFRYCENQEYLGDGPAAFDITFYLPFMQDYIGKNTPFLIIREIFGKGWVVVDDEKDKEYWLLNYTGSHGSMNGIGTTYYSYYMDPQKSLTFADVVYSAFNVIGSMYGGEAEGLASKVISLLENSEYNYIMNTNITNSTSLQGNAFIKFDNGYVEDIIWDAVPHQSNDDDISMDYMDGYMVSECSEGEYYDDQLHRCASCSTFGSDYKSKGGAGGAEEQCFRPCTLTCDTPATCSVVHTQSCSYNTAYTQNSGAQYYGSDTCTGTKPTCPVNDVVCRTGYVKNGLTCSPDTYTITYYDGATQLNNASPATYTYGTGVTAANMYTPTKTGYTFAGWYDAQTGGNSVTYIATNAYGAKTLYARWTPISCPSNYHFEYEKDISNTLPSPATVPTRRSLLDNSSTYNYLFEVSQGAYGDIGLNEWVMQYSNNDDIKGRALCTNVEKGFLVTNTTVDFDENTPAGPSCWCQAQTFNGQSVESHWSQYNTYSETGNCKYACSSQCAENSSNALTMRQNIIGAITEIPAGCVPDSYAINYNLNGGTNPAYAPNKYYYGTGFERLPRPTKDGYIFVGWYDNSGLTGNRVTSISANTTGAKTLYAKWETNKFWISAGHVETNGQFNFKISAAGTFYVDWGDGTETQIIDRSQLTTEQLAQSNASVTISHTYSIAGNRTIKFGGLATEYSTYKELIDSENVYNSAISFNVNGARVYSINGSLGAIFPTLNNASLTNAASKQPNFYKTFYGRNGFSTIPATLFSGITGTGIEGMFSGTFESANSLGYNVQNPIPATLFSGLTTGANEMFGETFAHCPHLTEIPEDLFSSFSGTLYTSMFHHAFAFTGLAEIPEDLFSGFSGTLGHQAFYATFHSTKITSIPVGLFRTFSAAQNDTFLMTFGANTLLTSIPHGLFDTFTNAGYDTFRGTFTNCTALESVPSDLFANIRTFYSMTYTFKDLFKNCSALDTVNYYNASGNVYNTTNFLPPTFFGKTLETWRSGIMDDTLENTGLATSCPNDTVSYDYDSRYATGLNGKAICWYKINYENTSGVTTNSNPAGYIDNKTAINYVDVEKTGYTFNGWYANSGLTGTPVTNIPAYSTQAQTVYAKWTPNTYTVSFNANGGTNGQSTDVTATYDAAMPAISATAPTRPGYTFTGWYDNATYTDSNAVQYYTAAGASARSYNKAAAATLYAGWDVNNYTVSFNANGGTGSMADQSFTYGTAQNLTTNTFTRSGFTFAGWATSANGEVVYTNGQSVNNLTPDANGTFTLYAKWNADYVFTLTTSATDSFDFDISAAGTFVVDCGTNGTLTWTGVSGNTITRDNTNKATYTCSYAGTNTTRTIRFGGDATGYSRSSDIAAISFYAGSNYINQQNNVQKITGITGSLGAIFHTVTAPASGQQSQPKFIRTFVVASNMTGTIPSNLFAGIHGAPIENMFESTFSGCSGLTGTIPSSLFAGIYGAPAEYMFSGTFYGCSGLTGSIPGTLFCQNINNPDATNCIYGVPASGMFNQTFDGCRGLTGSIPAKLFVGIHGVPANNMFFNTFHDCIGLTGSIPETLFCQNPNDPDATNCIYGAPASGMFEQTFWKCEGLTGSIPAKLFAGIHGAPAFSMFASTFSDCTGLTGSIPETLFCQNPNNPDATNCIYGAPNTQMFVRTFRGCSGLTGSIPAKLFVGIHGSPAFSMFEETFGACNGLTGSIPETLFCQNPNNPDATNCIYGAPNTQMFGRTFYGCSGLSGSIPAKLFAGIHGAPAFNMFISTFEGCSGLTGSIPETLFCQNPNNPDATNCIYGAPNVQMFTGAFSGCAGLTGSIPENLFAGIHGTPATDMFRSTFNGCSNINGVGNKSYVPTSFLSGITDNTSIPGQAYLMFTGTGLLSQCPAGTYTTTRQQFNNAGKPWCGECPNACANSDVGSNSAITGCYALQTPICTQNTCYPPLPDHCSSAVCAESCSCAGTQYKQYCDANGVLGSVTLGNTTESCTKTKTQLIPMTGYHAVGITSCSPNDVNINYDLNGGEVEITDQNTTCEYDNTFTLPATPTKPGYRFKGWLIQNGD